MLEDSSPAVRLTTLVAICALLFFAFLGIRDLWDIDEGMHAAMAQTMLLSGDWVTPVFNGEAFFDKPVMFNWLNAMTFWLFGFTEFAARLPAAVAGLGCVLLTWQLGRRLYGERVGFLAGLILATTLEFMILSRVVQYDIPFTFFVTLALFCFASAVVQEDKRRLYFLGFYAAAALAVLTKGPIGLILPGLVVAIYLADFLDDPRPKARRGWIIGVASWLIPVLLLAAYAIPNDPWTYWNHRTGIVWQHFEIFLIVFCVLLATTLLLLVMRKYRGAILSVAVTGPALAFFVLLIMVSGVNPYKGAKEIALQVDYILSDGQKIPMYGQMLYSALFYTGRDAQMLYGKENLRRYLDSPERRFVLMRSRERTEAKTFKGDYFVVLRIGNKAIVSNRPATLN